MGRTTRIAVRADGVLEHAPQLTGIAWSLARLEGEGPREHILDRIADRYPQGTRRRPVNLVERLGRELAEVIAFHDAAVGHRLEEHQTEGVDVGPRPDLADAVVELLGRSVGGRTCECCRWSGRSGPSRAPSRRGASRRRSRAPSSWSRRRSGRERSFLDSDRDARRPGHARTRGRPRRSRTDERPRRGASPSRDATAAR